MMESNFYSDEFEQLIKGKTEQYKMYPSEKVWKGVHGSLHTKRKWFIMGMSLLITGILVFAGKELIAPSGRSALAKKLPAVSTAAGGSAKTATESLPAPALRAFHNNIASSSTGKHNDQSEDAGTEDQPYKGITITVSHLVISQPDLSEFLSHAVRLPAEVPSLPVTAAARTAAAIPAEDRVTTAQGAENGGLNDNETWATARADAHITRVARNNTPSKNNLAATRSVVPDPVGDREALTDSAGMTVKNTVNFTESIADQQRINWLADYAVYNLRVAPKRGRKFLQLYMSPTVNYRALSGGSLASKSLIQNIPLAPFHLGDAKNYVDHNPSLGFEVGGILQYRLTRNLTVKGGLQFSFSRYTIKAYASSPQQATIALNSYYGYYLDSVTATSNIGNFGGKTQVSLNNDYYQLSAPVGFELRIMGNERLQLNLGATIQPTYLLNTNSYMLTTDYTNYIKEPSLLRRWNVNGGLEAFLSYKTRSGLRWQVGPEFRYQLLSSYDSQYPIHEHLKGYGIKFGIVKSLP